MRQLVYLFIYLFLFLIFAVSAFYAECLNKKIQFNAHIWTKSKFLGMSIGVHNIGQGKTDTFSSTIYFFHRILETNKNPLIFIQVVFPVWSMMSITFSPSLMDMAGMSWSVLVLSLTGEDHSPVCSLQVHPDSALGGAGWRVQHLLLQVGLQR